MQEKTEEFYEKVFLNAYGFYELKQKPPKTRVQEIFENEYFQNSMSIYEQAYTEQELAFMQKKLLQKEMIIGKNFQNGADRKCRMLDIGCGEGFVLKYFHEKGYDVLGLDFSEYGIQKQNPDMQPYVLLGDCYESLEGLIANGKKFDIVNMDSVLDMVYDPAKILGLIHSLLEADGIFIAKVNHNYSKLQKYLYDAGEVTQTYWLDEEGHYSYFNRVGLIAFLEKNGYRNVDFYGESFIDFNLLNPNTNYYENKSVGKSCHHAKMELEMMLMDASMEKTLEIARLLGEMDFGRELIGVFKKA